MATPTDLKVFLKDGAATELVPLGILSVPATSTNLAQLRSTTSLKNLVGTSTLFITSDGFQIPAGDEATRTIASIKKTDGSITMVKTAASTTAPVALPSLPTKPEMWDPSAPKVDFPRPSPLKPAESGAVPEYKRAGDLSFEEWFYVVKDNDLLRGQVLGMKSAAEDDGPKSSPNNVIAPPVEGAVLFSTKDGASFESDVSFTARSASYSSAGWGSASVDVSTPWASASVEASHRESHASTLETTATYTVAKYMISRAKIDFNERKLTPNPDFVSDVTEAVKITDAKERGLRFNKIFSEFGHLLPTTVILGGALIASTSSTSMKKSDRSKSETEVRAALKTATFGPGVSGGGSAGGGGSNDNSSSSQVGNEHVSTHSIGGEGLDFNKPAVWLNTVSDYRNWRVIGVERVMLTIDLLPAALKAELAKFEPVQAPLNGLWVPNRLMYNDQGTNASTRLNVYCPAIIQEGWYWLGQTLDPDWSLIVQEVIPGTLCPITTTSRLWDTAGGQVSINGYLGNPNPSDPLYTSLGSFFYNWPQKNDILPPDPTEVWDAKPTHYKKLRAIKTELLVRGNYDANPVWTDRGSSAPKDGSVWKIFRNDPTTIQNNHFRGNTGHGKPSAPGFTISSKAIRIMNPEIREK